MILSGKTALISAVAVVLVAPLLSYSTARVLTFYIIFVTLEQLGEVAAKEIDVKNENRVWRSATLALRLCVNEAFARIKADGCYC